MIVTIDGPAGAGKSSVARALARRLGFRFLDTGAMYRAVALAAMRHNICWETPQQIAQLAAAVHVQLEGARVYLDGEDVSAEIRSPQVTSLVHYIADNPEVRARLVELQRRAAAESDTVTEGRDQGTVAFPHAECKIFLTATPGERARRRERELRERGERVELDTVFTQMRNRDQQDSSRPVGRLKKAQDAIEVVTDGMTQEEVVDRLEEIVRTAGEHEPATPK